MVPDGISEEVFAITQDIFTALIDHEEGMLNEWWDEKPEFSKPLYSWVDMDGEDAARCLLQTESTTAHDITRCLLDMDPGEDVSPEDLVDALGEVANVVGGNLKSLVPDPGDLTLPQVSETSPDNSNNELLGEAMMSWRGQILIISTWAIKQATEGAN